MHIQRLPILWDTCHRCSCGFCEVHYRQINKHTHTEERKHRKRTQRGPACRAISPPGVLRSIDPARLLSAGYVSSTAALPVRGRARAVEGVREVEINGEIGAPAGRGRESGEEERTQGWCHGGNRGWNTRSKRGVWWCVCSRLTDFTLEQGQRWNGGVCQMLLCIIAPREKGQ